jgi:hypothetical protein
MRRLRPTALLFLAVAVLAAAALLAAPRAYAGPEFPPSTSVVLFTPAAPDPLVARLEAELAAVGIEVRKVNMPPEGQVEAAVSRELARGASAAIRIIPRSRGADVWTGDATAGTLRRQATGVGTSDLPVIALQTVEFLRATLLGATGGGPAAPSVTVEAPAAQGAEAPAAPGRAEALRRGSGEPPGPGAATESRASERADQPTSPPGGSTALATNRPRLPEWGLKAPAEASVSEPVEPEIFVGPALMASPGGVPLVASVAVMGRVLVSPQAGLELMAVFPLASRHLSNPEGTVAIQTALFGAALAFRLPTPRRLYADGALGASALMLRAEGAGTGGVGTGSTPNVGSVQTAWKVAGTARVGGGLHLNRWLSLRADVLGGLTGRTAVGYDVTDVGGQTIMTDRASWGPVFAVATAGLQASW